MPSPQPPIEDVALLDYLDKMYVERRDLDARYLGSTSYDLRFGKFIVTVSPKDDRTFRELVSDVIRRDLLNEMERAFNAPHK